MSAINNAGIRECAPGAELGLQNEIPSLPSTNRNRTVLDDGVYKVFVFDVSCC